jgi:hypothetical protein
MTKKTIQGKIIRIVDKQTAVINLGSDNGISHDSIFIIKGDTEEIIDPDTNEVLGSLKVVKSKLKSAQVHKKFTIATTKWTIVSPRFGTLGEVVGQLFENKVVDQGDLRVVAADIQPWLAQSEEPVRVGDIVEVTVDIPDDTKIIIQQDSKLLESSDQDASDDILSQEEKSTEV